mmetsp:Transcript_373/g.531  ORF Transcript_373/g.531 Transcript_373/m.531 type:complete len:143 (-) Transcript_373:3064-3492(-)
MNENEINPNIAETLLNSPDAKVAAAAKRIFQAADADTIDPLPPTSAPVKSAPLLLNYGNVIPTNIQEQVTTAVTMQPLNIDETPKTTSFSINNNLNELTAPVQVVSLSSDVNVTSTPKIASSVFAVETNPTTSLNYERLHRR